jgi:hypothetical protein
LVDLRAAIAEAAPLPFAAAPTLVLRARLVETTGVDVHALTLQAAVRIEPARRPYSPGEEARLVAHFGPSHRWAEAMHPFAWADAAVNVGRFRGEVDVDLPIACTYDLAVGWADYLHALDDGEVPLLVLFSGTVFTIDGGGLVVEPVPWHVEARYRLPVKVLDDVMAAHFPDSEWLRLPRRTLDALARYKARRALPSWEAAIGELLGEAEQ